MKKEYQKQVLLETRMTDLGLGGSFGNYFLRFPRNNKRMSPYEPAITLAEFLNRNQKLLRKPMDRFSCDAEGDGFTLQSVAFKKLKVFLLEHGFSATDWIMLKGSQKQGNLFPFSFDNKTEIGALRIVTLGLIKQKTGTFQLLLEMVPDVEPELLTINDVLRITSEDIEVITGVPKSWAIPYERVQALRIVITKLQEKLQKMGLTPDDGPFMNISFKKQQPVQVGVGKAA